MSAYPGPGRDAALGVLEAGAPRAVVVDVEPLAAGECECDVGGDVEAGACADDPAAAEDVGPRGFIYNLQSMGRAMGSAC
jgi:hypothetical protein